jgi:uncharacterized protein (TIGR02996 family)
MSDEDAFWRAINERPGDLLPVGVFADWLDERGDVRAKTLRMAVAGGRFPEVRPTGLAWWVTTTANPVAWRSVPRGRLRSPPAPVRPQPSWLAGFYWRFLAGAQEPLPFVYSGTVWHYPSAANAWKDLCEAQRKMGVALVDPKTGKGAFVGVTGSAWRDESRRVIAVALAALPADADRTAKAKALRDAYPFGERRGWPYKAWLAEQRIALGTRPGTASRVPQGGGCGWCNGRGCVACAAKRWAATSGSGATAGHTGRG